MKKFLSLIFIISTATTFGQQQKITVYFDFNKYDLSERSIIQLDSLIQTRPANIQLTGHCDAIGNHLYNDKLSLQRVDAVKEYLLSKGLTENYFEDELGLGKRKPVNDNATPDERLLNRRVDILYSVVQQDIPRKSNDPLPPVDTSTISTLETKIQDTATKAGDNIVLKNLNFIGGRHILLPGSEPLLQELLEVLKKYPALKIEIQGHICCIANGTDGRDFDTQTDNLSVNRARAIYAFLVDKGIDTARLSYKGFGSTRPLVFPERNEEEKTANRRVEIKIISK